MGRGPFCDILCAIDGTEDLVTDDDRAEAERLRVLFGWDETPAGREGSDG